MWTLAYFDQILVKIYNTKQFGFWSIAWKPDQKCANKPKKDACVWYMNDPTNHMTNGHLQNYLSGMWIPTVLGNLTFYLKFIKKSGASWSNG